MNYEFTGETKTVYGVTLHRIRATKDIPRLGVMSGDVGGWIEQESNLSDDAWVFGEARVYVAADVAQLCVGTEAAELKYTARAAGAEDESRRHVGDAVPAARNEYVARVFSLGE